jgi:hypothetical protein
MKKNKNIDVKGISITVNKRGADEFICITDIAKYKKVMDRCIRIHRKKMRQKIHNLRSTNPKEYWKIINSGRKQISPIKFAFRTSKFLSRFSTFCVEPRFMFFISFLLAMSARYKSSECRLRGNCQISIVVENK